MDISKKSINRTRLVVMGPSKPNPPCGKCGTHHTATEDCPADFTKEEYEFRQEYRTWGRAKKRAYKKAWLKSKPPKNFCVKCKKEVGRVEYNTFGGKCIECSTTIE